MTTRRPVTFLALAGAAAIGGLLPAAGGGIAHADGPITVSTPYPAIETEPSSTVKLDINVASTQTAAVDLALGGLPAGWKATMRGGGFVVKAVTATPSTPAKAELEIDVPPDAGAGSYPMTVTGTDGANTSTVPITLDVAQEVDSGIQIAADFPSLKGEPGNAFTYNLTITNNTPEQQTFTFDPTGPQGWTVTASPTTNANAQTVNIDAGSNSTVKVDATPPQSVAEGKYPIDVAVSAANGATGKIDLTAEVTGAPKLTLQTADQKLNTSGPANSEKRIPMIVSNTGTAALTDVQLAGTAPTGWDVSFDPKSLPTVKPNETAQVTAIVKPAKNSVAGDYTLTVRSSAGSESSNVDLRYTLQGSRTLGFLAIGVIVVAFLVLAGVFVRFGRR
jgi:uncharacterized membrane protein